MIDEFLEPSGISFADELVYRYLLTKGDAIGGSARNLAGSLGDRKFLQTLLSVMSLAGVEYSWRDRKTKRWISGPVDGVGVEKQMNALHWRNGDRDRLLLNNVKVPLIDKNVDLVLLDAMPSDWQDKDRSLLIQNSRYLALGQVARNHARLLAASASLGAILVAAVKSARALSRSPCSTCNQPRLVKAIAN